MGLCILMVACNKPQEEPHIGTVITKIFPTEGKPRDTIRITGRNFKPYNTNVVIFGGNRTAKIAQTSDNKPMMTENELVVLVPDSGVVSGPIKVRVGTNVQYISLGLFLKIFSAILTR